MRMPDPDSMNAAHALGLLLIGAIEHLTARDYCCPYCCPSCAGLSYYWNHGPENISNVAVSLALDGQRPDWYLDDGGGHDEAGIGGGGINWPYLFHFWTGSPAHECEPAAASAATPSR